MLTKRRRLTCAIAVLFIIGGSTIIGCSSDQQQTPEPLVEYKLGVADQKAGDVSGAITHFQNAVHLDPSLRMANAKLAEMYRVRGDYLLAAKQYQVAARLDPYEESNHYYLGVSQQFLARFKLAAGSYLRALNLKPTDSRAMTNLGVVYIALGQPQAAEKWLKQATEIDPTSAGVWLNYGAGLDAIGRRADAEAAYRHALELNSGMSTALEDLATNLVAQKKTNEAITACEQLLLRRDSAIARTRYGQALALRGDDNAAAAQFNLALERDPHSSIALSAKAFFLIDQYRKGMELDVAQRNEALTLWNQSLAINANQPSVRAAVDKWQSNQIMMGE